MSGTAALLLYGVVLAWLCPPILDRITRNGRSPQLSVMLWLTAIVVTAGVWLAAGAGLIADLIFAHHGAAPVRFCLDMMLTLHHRGWAGGLVLAAVAIAGLVTSVVVTRRLTRALLQLTARSREHACAARLLGGGTRPRRDGVVIVPSEQPAAYCVAGRPSVIVVTSGALSSLAGDELGAVLAHERAHLRGHHPQLMMLLGALATAMPLLPLFRIGRDAVGRLVEMCADDSAARRHGADTLLSGLCALVGQPRTAGTALGAGDTAVLARALRLAAPAGRGARLRQHLILVATMAGLWVTPTVILLLCHH